MDRAFERPEEEYLSDILALDSPAPRSFLFGQFLRMKGLITEEDVFNARMMQRQHNRRIGELAREKGWLSTADVARILTYQEEDFRKFGQVALEQGYISLERLEGLLKEMQESYVLFGEALVNLGVLTKEEMGENFVQFQRLRLEGEHHA